MAAGITYSTIATNTLSSAAASVTFSSFAGYTDIRMIFTGSFSSASDWPAIELNTDTGNNYSYTQVTSVGALSYRGSSIPFMVNGGHSATANTQVTAIMDFQNYSNSTTFKTMLSHYADTSSGITATVNLWRNTGAITSIKIRSTTAGTFNTGSTFTLYGIAAA